jgi:uncharacterized membrane protein
LFSNEKARHLAGEAAKWYGWRMASSRFWGYLIAALITAPLVGWAKHSSTGMMALIAVSVLAFSYCVYVRISEGAWP